MGINVIDPAGTDRVITGINVVDPAGTDRALVQINAIGPDGTDRVVWTSGGGSSLAVSLTPVAVAGFTRGTGIATTTAITAAASGGTPPYTYSWDFTAYDNVIAPTANAPSSAMTNFTQSNIGFGESYSATPRVTVRDSAGSPATITASGTASWFDTSGGSSGGSRLLETSR